MFMYMSWEDRGVRLREAETGPPSLPLPFFALAALGGDFPPGTGESWLLLRRISASLESGAVLLGHLCFFLPRAK